MKFEKSDLLSYEEIENILSNDSPNDRAEIICAKLKKYAFIFDGELYLYDTNLIVYKKIDINISDQILCVISGYLTESKRMLSKEQSKLLSLERKSEYQKFCENAYINKMLPQLTTNLMETETKFKGDFYEIHYKNGYLNLKNLKFEKRIPNKHFITNYIPRDYIPSTEAQRTEFLRRIGKIYPVQEDLNAILFILGSALTGKATKEQKILFLLGTGSNGKSAILQILENSICGYMETLEEEAFSMTNKNPDKTFSTFMNRPHIRIIWNNEPKADQMNASTFKKFVEGEMKGKLLYKNAVHNFNHNALPIFTANFLPNIKIDGGVKRRFRGYNHTSLFTTNKNEVDEKNHIYLVDRDLVDNMKNDNLLEAFIDILAKYANMWINGEEIPNPKSFQIATEEMMEVNDHIQDFIDAKLKILQTQDKKNRIGKTKMLELYHSLYPKKNLSVQQLISLLKVKVSWDKELRCPETGIKGCFYNVEERLPGEEIIEEIQEISPLDANIPVQKVSTTDSSLQSQNDKLIAENQRMTDELKALQKEISRLKKIAKNVKLDDGNVYNYSSEELEEKLLEDEINAILNAPVKKVSENKTKNIKIV